MNPRLKIRNHRRKSGDADEDIRRRKAEDVDEERHRRKHEITDETRNDVIRGVLLKKMANESEKDKVCVLACLAHVK